MEMQTPGVGEGHGSLAYAAIHGAAKCRTQLTD